MFFKRFFISILLVILPFMFGISLLRLSRGNDPFVSIKHVKARLELYDPPDYLRTRLFNDNGPDNVSASFDSMFSRVTGLPTINKTTDAEKLLYYVLLFPIDLIGDIGYTVVFMINTFNFLGSV